jgi:fatty acid desaturase
MRLPAELVIQCSQGSNLRAALDVAFNWGGLLLVIAAAHALDHWASYAVAVVLIGSFQNRLIVFSHECWHRKAFRPQWLNQLVGACFYSYPVATPYFSDQARHMRHHRLLGKPEDPDWIDYERDEFHSVRGVLGFLIGQLFGAKVVLRFLDLLKAGRGEQHDARATNRRVKPEPSDLVGIAVFQALIFGAFVAAGRWWEYFVLWVLPLATVASFLVTCRALLEHVHPDRDVAPQERYFDFSPGPLQRWFLSPSLFHLHALHHTYPGVPYFRLPDLARTIEVNGYERPGRLKPDYLTTLVQYLRELERKPLRDAA